MSLEKAKKLFQQTLFILVPMQYSYQDLLDIMAKLRSEQGCPWDREQNHQSLLPYLLEEATEAIEAAQSGDMDHFCEELGDVLLQIVFHAQIGKEQGTFDMDAVVHGIAEKLVRRHPHVFAQATAETPDQVTAQWDEIKKQEKLDKKKPLVEKSVLDKVSRALPTLMRAQKLQNRAAKVGFDWPDVTGVLDKIREESQEIADEILPYQKPGTDSKESLSLSHANRMRIQDEIGDLLFVLVNLSRHAGVDAEQAAIGGNAKFERRFRAMEVLASQRQLDWSQMNLEEMDKLWNEVKAQEKTATKEA